jgi:hypothetical protein
MCAAHTTSSAKAKAADGARRSPLVRALLSARCTS